MSRAGGSDTSSLLSEIVTLLWDLPTLSMMLLLLLLLLKLTFRLS